ncbi:hypothetical protein BS78_07G130600 [Paspalum vaginatum]|nr:hypothetical protein BS78_07G130600 [Paspalum vaginatum]
MAALPSPSRRDVRSLIILVCWELWKERNARIFDRSEVPSFKVAARIKEEAAAWILAGAKHLDAFVRRS